MLTFHQTTPLNTVKHNERIKKSGNENVFPSSDLTDISPITKLKSKHTENIKVINNV